MHRRLLPAVALLPFACGETTVTGTAGAATLGRWRLVTIDQMPLPVVVGSTFAYVERLDSAVLEFRRYDRVLDIRHLSRRYSLGGALQFITDTLITTYERRGDQLIIRRPVGFDPTAFADTGQLIPSIEILIEVHPAPDISARSWRYEPSS